jgi:hypothetical protein
MKLRDYSSINWPPNWTRIEGEGDPTLTGEIGILRSIVRSRFEPLTTCYLMMDFQGCSYMGTLSFREGSLSRQVFELLQQHSGDSLHQIGNLEFNPADDDEQMLDSKSGHLLEQILEQSRRLREESRALSKDSQEFASQGKSGHEPPLPVLKPL